VEKQLKVFLIRSVPTVADFRIRFPENLSGYVPVIVWLSTIILYIHDMTDPGTYAQHTSVAV
jgi:hypothetical protein